MEYNVTLLGKFTHLVDWSCTDDSVLFND